MREAGGRAGLGLGITGWSPAAQGLRWTQRSHLLSTGPAYLLAEGHPKATHCQATLSPPVITGSRSPRSRLFQKRLCSHCPARPPGLASGVGVGGGSLHPAPPCPGRPSWLPGSPAPPSKADGPPPLSRHAGSRRDRKDRWTQRRKGLQQPVQEAPLTAARPQERERVEKASHSGHVRIARASPVRPPHTLQLPSAGPGRGETKAPSRPPPAPCSGWECQVGGRAGGTWESQRPLEARRPLSPGPGARKEDAAGLTVNPCTPR